jgi:hypothetical protein
MVQIRLARRSRSVPVGSVSRVSRPTVSLIQATWFRISWVMVVFHGLRRQRQGCALQCAAQALGDHQGEVVHGHGVLGDELQAMRAANGSSRRWSRTPIAGSWSRSQASKRALLGLVCQPAGSADRAPGRGFGRLHARFGCPAHPGLSQDQRRLDRKSGAPAPYPCHRASPRRCLLAATGVGTSGGAARLGRVGDRGAARGDSGRVSHRISLFTRE